MSSGFGANGMNPSSNMNDATGSGGPNTGDRGAAASADDFLNFNSNMFMGGDAANMDEMWGIGGSDAAANIFFNMDAFSSAPATAIETSTVAGAS
ncbi:hypothetical protein LPJ53_006138, partial [Coemansia erecta]